MTDENLSYIRAYREGRNAARDGLSINDCPYTDYLLRANWECGFEDEWCKIFEGSNV